MIAYIRISFTGATTRKGNDQSSHTYMRNTRQILINCDLTDNFNILQADQSTINI